MKPDAFVSCLEPIVSGRVPVVAIMNDLTAFSKPPQPLGGVCQLCYTVLISMRSIPSSARGYVYAASLVNVAFALEALFNCSNCRDKHVEVTTRS